MPKTLLAIAQRNRQAKKISLMMALRYDIIPWLFSAAAGIAAFWAVSRFLVNANNAVGTDNTFDFVFSMSIPLFFAVVAVMVFMARRSVSIWTWVFSAIITLGVLPGYYHNIANTLYPVSLFESAIVMLLLLTIERLAEYFHMRFVTNLSEPKLGLGAWLVYLLIIAGALFLIVPGAAQLVA